jgi:hypothetical protein
MTVLLGLFPFAQHDFDSFYFGEIAVAFALRFHFQQSPVQAVAFSAACGQRTPIARENANFTSRG